MEDPLLNSDPPTSDKPIDDKPVDDQKPAEDTQGDKQDGASGDAEKGDDKSGDDQAGKAGAPEKYEFTAPEGATYEKEFIDAYSEAAKELDLTQEGAQKLLDKVAPVVRKQQVEQIEAVRNQWTESSKADKEFGGDKLDENLAVAKKALDQFGTPELTQFMKETGLGNHPELIRLFYRVGKNLNEDTFVGGKRGEGKTGPKTFNDMATTLYGNS